MSEIIILGFNTYAGYLGYCAYKDCVRNYRLKPNEIPKDKYFSIRLQQLLCGRNISSKEAIRIISIEMKMMEEGFIE